MEPQKPATSTTQTYACIIVCGDERVSKPGATMAWSSHTWIKIRSSIFNQVGKRQQLREYINARVGEEYWILPKNQYHIVTDGPNIAPSKSIGELRHINFVAQSRMILYTKLVTWSLKRGKLSVCALRYDDSGGTGSLQMVELI
jgi:hypothetical protein